MRIVGAHLAKLLEYLWLILQGDSDSCVTDRYLYRTVRLPGFNSNLSPLWGELHRVGQQVEKNLFDLPLITHELPKTLVDRDIESDAVLGGPFAHKRARVVYRQGQIECSQL